MKNKSIFAPLSIVLIIANVIAFNLLSSRLFGRIDLTENNMYTLSDVTKSTLRNLEEPLTIKAYFTKDLPAPYNSIARFVEDQLSEMKAYGRGSFRYEFLDPGSEEELKKEAEKFRLEPIQVNEMRADKVEFKLAYLGMVLLYEDKQEVIPAIQSLQQLEYEILTKIKRITADDDQVIGFLEGHEETPLRQEMTMLDRELRKLYDIKPVDLTSRASVPEEIDLLCVVGPKQNFSEKDKFAIDQFIMRGGKLFMCMNKIAADLQTMQADKSALRVDNWTEHYGFKVNDELVLDSKAPTLPFQTMTRYGRQITLVRYPLFPEIVGFNRDYIAMSNLRQVRLYFPSSIDTSLTAEMENVTISPLLWSSDKSSTQTGSYDINPLTFNQRGMVIYDQAKLPLGAVLNGKFTSFWKDKSVPLDSDGNKISEEEIIPESPETRIVVIGDANFINDQFLVQGLDNLTMALNLIDWLVQDESLISIRSREVSSRPIEEVSDAARKTVKYANMLIPPLLIIVFGLFRWKIRSATKKAMVAGYAASRTNKVNSGGVR